VTDLLAYLRTQTGGRGPGREFAPGPPDKGSAIFREKKCVACHTGPRSLEGRPTRYTLTDLAAAMWNHPFQVQSRMAALTYEEMRDLVGYVLSMQFFEERGDIEHGRKLFRSKRCGACHDGAPGSAPPRTVMAGRMTSFAIMAALFRHGPAMLETMRRRNLSWPRFDAAEMADLSAYLHGLELKRRTAR
jgi:cytochrome c2